MLMTLTRTPFKPLIHVQTTLGVTWGIFNYCNNAIGHTDIAIVLR